MSERAAIYARVSTDIQRDNYSIPSQIIEMVKYAKGRGYVLVGSERIDPETGRESTTAVGVPAFVDDFSSRELSRPGLDSALQFLDSSGFDVLIVHALDRLARDPYIRQTIEREFAAHGTRIEYVLGNYEESPEGEVRKDLDATFAKWENAKRVERTNRGKRRKAESGKYVAGVVPFGYRSDPDAPGGLAVYEPEAKTVRTIFEWFLEGKLSIHRIVSELNKQGITTYYENAAWAKSSVQRLLKNTVYAGYTFYNKHKRQGKKLVIRDESEWVKINCNPIIDPAAFREVQELLKNNREYSRRHSSRFYLLSGMVICSNCKKAYITQTAKAGRNRRLHDMPTYRHRVSQGHCSNKSISGRVLEAAVWNGLTRVLLNPASLREGYEQTMEQEKEKQARQIKHMETLQAALEKLKLKKAKLQVAYLDPDFDMTKAEYLEQKAAIDDQMKAAIIEVEEISRALEHIPTANELKSMEQFAAKIAVALGKDLVISPADKRQIMQMLNLKVLIAREGKVKLEGWFAAESDGLSSTMSEDYVRPRRKSLAPA